MLHRSLNFEEGRPVLTLMTLPPAIRATQYTHENGLDVLFFKSAKGPSGWVVRSSKSPVRFYHPGDREWVVAHRVTDWTPFFMGELAALSLLSTLEVPQ